MAEKVYWTIYSVWSETIDGRKVLRSTPEAFDEDDYNYEAVLRLVQSRRERSGKLIVLGPYEVTYDEDIDGKASLRDRSVSNRDISPPPDGFFDELRKATRGTRLDDTLGSGLAEKGN